MVKKEKVIKVVSPEMALAKEFVGRIKYMVYMDSMAKLLVKWEITVTSGKHILSATAGGIVGKSDIAIKVNNKLVPFAPKDTLMDRVLNMVVSIS